MSDPIEFDGTIYKVQTLVDQGLRFTIDAPETAIVAAAQLMACKREGLVLHIIIGTDKQPESIGQENGVQKGRERKSIRATA
jgi:hypothetical protein